ncbi:hypothetical protein CR205_09955 [Alteribacter lacisalsi]|uniref:Uncharacterized protein n=1 Tax=Alteribacter lacisalsi TaxID=2045244 RepID=A0A2W0HG13_9BACI|nr:hypothetical protein [Alteribacter lacisalsi]PYZ98870.1 hypothetical protein CR205_09955 [Alteribacter lacisalsi]
MCEKKDLENQGRQEAYLDVDRMTNEGLAGGKDHIAFGKRQIEESQDIHEEEAPRSSGKKD